MDGVGLLATMRLQGYAMPFIVIIIIAFPEENVCAEGNAIDFFAKPFALPSLIACLAAALTP
jgi:hypothetical protein